MRSPSFGGWKVECSEKLPDEAFSQSSREGDMLPALESIALMD